MDSPEFALFMKGVGSRPTVQANVVRKFKSHGVEVEEWPPDFAGKEYNNDLTNYGRFLKDRFDKGQRTSLIAASGSVKTALSLHLRYPDYIHRVVAIAGKVDPYDYKVYSTATKLPGLAMSDATLQQDLENASPETLQTVSQGLYWIESIIDEEIDKPEDPEDQSYFYQELVVPAKKLIVPAHTHIGGIAFALTFGVQLIANHLQHE